MNRFERDPPAGGSARKRGHEADQRGGGPPDRSGGWGREATRARRRPAVAALTGSLLLVGAIGLAGVLWQWRQAETARADALKKAASETVAKEAALKAQAAEENEAYIAKIALAAS